MRPRLEPGPAEVGRSSGRPRDTPGPAWVEAAYLPHMKARDLLRLLFVTQPKKQGLDDLSALREQVRKDIYNDPLPSKRQVNDLIQMGVDSADAQEEGGSDQGRES